MDTFGPSRSVCSSRLEQFLKQKPHLLYLKVHGCFASCPFFGPCLWPFWALQSWKFHHQVAWERHCVYWNQSWRKKRSRSVGINKQTNKQAKQEKQNNNSETLKVLLLSGNILFVEASSFNSRLRLHPSASSKFFDNVQYCLNVVQYF